MKYLITGGAGFIGSHISDVLIKKGDNVVVIDNLITGKEQNLNKSAKFYKIDIESSEIKEIFNSEKPDIVLHFAAHIEARESLKDPLFDAKINILGSLNILQACKEYNVKKIIFASSGGEIYGDAQTIPTSEEYQPQPISPYGISKFCVEKYIESYAKLYGIDFTILRFGNVYGPRQNPNGEAGVIAIFTDKMIKGEQVFIHGNGKQTKDYIFINDVVSAVTTVLKDNTKGIFNIATGKETSVLEIFEKIKKLTNSNVKKEHIEFPLVGFERGCLSIKKAKEILKWIPEYDLDKGLEETIKWFKNYEY